jgi:hypothetical protein
MPHNPNDPNSDEHHPEKNDPNHESVYTIADTTPDDPYANMTAKQKITACYVHTMVRGQPVEAQMTVTKLEQIHDNLEAKIITKETALTMLAALEANDIPQWIKDEVAIEFVNKAVEAIKNY